MTKIYDGTCLTIHYDTDNNIFINVWKNENLLSENVFKKECLAFRDQMIEHKPAGVLLDTLKGDYAISVELQKWHDETIGPYYQEARMRKMAVLVNPDIFTHVSIQQALSEENTAQLIISRFFTDKAKALEWLKSKKEAS